MIEQHIVWFDVTMDELEFVNELDGENRFGDVESRLDASANERTNQ
jgi:hypothetical protein